MLHPGDPTDLYSFLLERDRYLGLLRALPLPALAVWLLALVGAWRAVAVRRQRAWPLACFVALQTGVLLLFFVSTRLRLPLLFCLAPFAGFALVEGVRAWGRGRFRGLSIGVALAVAASVFWWSVVAAPTVREVLRLASVLSMQGRLQESLEVLEPWTREPAPDPLALDQSGWVHQKGGRLVPAERLYLRALGAGLPGERAAQTRTRLGRVYQDLGRPDAARAQYDEAVRLAPDRGGPRYERGLFRLHRGDRRGAVRDLRDAARLEPGWSAPLETLRSLGEIAPPPGDGG
jgi:tetratricopeptide (TPR) repeat protein